MVWWRNGLTSAMFNKHENPEKEKKPQNFGESPQGKSRSVN